MGILIDMTGQRFGRLVVISLHNAGKTSKWNCVCDCGKKTIVASQNLRKGLTKSCGCLSAESRRRTIHGLTNENRRLLGIWYGMKNRCYDTKNCRYNFYGGKGVIICEEWKNDPKAFFDWAMSNGYKDNLSIDRIDNDGNYCPENCRWASGKEQARNKSTNKKLTVRGITKTIIEWCEITGMKFKTI